MKKIIGWFIFIGSVVFGIIIYLITGKNEKWKDIEDQANKSNDEFMKAEQIKIDRIKELGEIKDENKTAVNSMDRNHLINDILRNIGDKP